MQVIIAKVITTEIEKRIHQANRKKNGIRKNNTEDGKEKEKLRRDEKKAHTKILYLNPNISVTILHRNWLKEN